MLKKKEGCDPESVHFGGIDKAVSECVSFLILE